MTADPAAAFLEAGGRRRPAWYGPPEAEGVAVGREYAAAREGAALADLGDRGVLAVSGPLRQKFLHNVLSNDIAGREAGQGCLAALMDVKGHVEALMRVLVSKDVVTLELAADRLDRVESTLTRYRVAAPVRFDRQPVAILAVLGPAAGDVLGRAGIAVRELPAENHLAGIVEGRAVLVARASDIPGGAYVVHAAASDALATWDALRAAGAVPLGDRALDALRVEDGRPWYGTDVTEENLLHETGLLREYHSATKGCYVGQEVVARLEARGGHVNKALRSLRLTHPSTPGAPVCAEGREVGRVTTAAVSPRHGPVALGYVHRGHFEPGTAVDVGGAAATVVALPLAG